MWYNWVLAVAFVLLTIMYFKQQREFYRVLEEVEAEFEMKDKKIISLSIENTLVKTLLESVAKEEENNNESNN